jgi:ATP-dependent exoDNAse (exonuclease V) alpha subunit
MVQAGCVNGPELVVDGRPFAAGDRVLMRRNDRRLRVANGDRAVVVSVDAERGSLGIRVGKRDVVLPRTYLDAGGRTPLQHGYAMTGHAAQGLTTDRAFVLATGEASREWLYMALSRGRLDNRVYGAVAPDRERDEFAPSEPRTPAEQLLELAAHRSAAKQMALESRVRARGRDRDIGLDL